MKVVLARQRIGERFGGAEGYVAMLAKAMRDRDVEVVLMAQAVDPGLESAGFPTIRVPGGPTNLSGVRSFARAVGRYAREEPSHPLISFDRTPGVRIVRAGDGCHRAYLRAMGQSMSARFSLKHLVLLSLERRMFTHPELQMVIANSKMVADEIHEFYGVPREKIQVMHTGIPPSPVSTFPPKANVRSKVNISSGVRFILFAGHHYERKGLETVLWALYLMGLDRKGRSDRAKGGSGRNWMLGVAGKGNIPKYQAMANWLGIGDSVRFFGPRDLEELFAAADMFVLPTRYDPLARVCLEAARAGVPVVTTRQNGFSELMDAAEGFVMEHPQDAAELAGMMSRVFSANVAEAGIRLRARTAHLTIAQNAEDVIALMARTSGRSDPPE